MMAVNLNQATSKADAAVEAHVAHNFSYWSVLATAPAETSAEAIGQP